MTENFGIDVGQLLGITLFSLVFVATLPKLPHLLAGVCREIEELWDGRSGPKRFR
jgi:hypothetical protein